MLSDEERKEKERKTAGKIAEIVHKKEQIEANPHNSIPKEIEIINKIMPKFKKTLADLFELDKMEPQEAAQTVDRLGKLVFQATLARVLPLLSDGEVIEYEKIVSGKEGEKIFTFLNEKVPDFENIVKEESENLRKEIASEFVAAGV